MAHNTLSTTYKSEAAGAQRMTFKNGMIITYDSNDVASSVYGYIASISDIPILVIAKSGYDVFTDVLEVARPDV